MSVAECFSAVILVDSMRNSAALYSPSVLTPRISIDRIRIASLKWRLKVLISSLMKSLLARKIASAARRARSPVLTPAAVAAVTSDGTQRKSFGSSGLREWLWEAIPQNHPPAKGVVKALW